MFDPTVGRWFEEDPEGLTAGPNLYEYVGNGPTNANDPSGRVLLAANRQDAETLVAALQKAGADLDRERIFQLGDRLFYIHTDDRDKNALFTFARGLLSTTDYTKPQPVQPRERFLLASGALGEVNAANENVLVSFPKAGVPTVQPYNLAGFQRLAVAVVRQKALGQYPGGLTQLDVGGEIRHFVEGVINVNINKSNMVQYFIPSELRDRIDVPVDPVTGVVGGFPLWFSGTAFNLSTLQLDPAQKYPPGPFHQHSIDTIYVEESISLFMRHPEFWEGVVRILKPGGKVIINEKGAGTGDEAYRNLIAAYQLVYNVNEAAATQQIKSTPPPDKNGKIPLPTQKTTLYKYTLDKGQVKETREIVSTWVFQIGAAPPTPIAPPPRPVS